MLITEFDFLLADRQAFSQLEVAKKFQARFIDSKVNIGYHYTVNFILKGDFYMCGIVGYTGVQASLPILMEGLKMLEYRGYDSAGIALLGKNSITTVKSKGKLSNLEERLAALELGEMHCGIGHTRWATHGEPSDVNSHPHATERLALVHNGIVENHAEIEVFLKEKGYSFISGTDTERAAKLIDHFYRETHDPAASIFRASSIIKGSYAFGIIFADHPEKIFAIRRDSPLILAKSPAGALLASDIPAVLPYTKEYCRLDENYLAVLTKSDIKIFDAAMNEITPVYEKALWNAEQAKKGGFPHFMLKEIYEEPAALESTVMRRIRDGLPFFDEDFPSDILLESTEQIHVVACGTAMHAGLIGKYIIEKLARVPVSVEIASEFRYRDPILRENSLAIFISQSGETADTLAALRHAKEKGVPTLAIVNVFGSSLAREADFTLYTMAGPEIAVASTKAYTVQSAIFYLFATHLALIKGEISVEDATLICSKLSSELPLAIGATLTLNDKIRAIAQKISSSEHLFYVGRGIDYQLSVESSLKLKEISYIHSEAYAAGELKHGTISLITDGVPVICIITDSSLAKKTVSCIHEVMARGASVTIICADYIAKEHILPDCQLIILPTADSLISPFVATTATQLLAYHASAHKGIDVDKPRNLAKSVTVE